MDDRHNKIFQIGIFSSIVSTFCGWQRLQLPTNKKYQHYNQLFFSFLRHSFLLSFPTVPTFRCLLKVLWNTQTNNISLGAQSQPQSRRDVQDIRKEPFLQIKSRFYESKSLSLNLYLFLRLEGTILTDQIPFLRK